MKITEQEIMAYYGIAAIPQNTSFAMAYVPFQQNNSQLYAVHKGFESGTMYPELDKPFYGKDCKGGE